MKKANMAVLALALLSQYSMAVCTLDTTPPDGGSSPVTLTIPGATILVDADTAASSSTPIATYQTGTAPKISFLDCTASSKTGRRVIPERPPLSDQYRTFSTNIDGIEVKPLWNRSDGAVGRFPSETFAFTGGLQVARLNFDAGSSFTVEIYKTKPKITLTDRTAGDLVLNSSVIADIWVEEKGQSHAMQLAIGDIRIISTPVCSLDGEKTVDFNTVSATNITNGVKRPLNFSLTCATDYGNYTASAALSTQTPTTDNAYIKVRDQAGNTDRLKISVDDSTGTALTVDGNTKESKSSVGGVPTQFSWSATLLRDSLTDLPVSGTFTAEAEIILLVN